MEHSLERDVELGGSTSSAAATTPSLDPPRGTTVELRRPHAIAFDSEDLRLTRWGCSLRFRLPDQWTLELPPAGRPSAPAPDHYTFTGRPDAVPEPALDLATAFLRGAVPVPLIELGTLQCPRSGPAEIVRPTLDRCSPARDLFGAALGSSVEQLVRYDASIRLGADPDAVHRARLAVRRADSHLRTFLPILERGWARSLRERLRWLGDGLSAARDADVLLERLEHHADALPDVDRRQRDLVLQLLRTLRDAAHRKLLAMLHDARYVTLLDEIVAAARWPHFGPRADEPARRIAPDVMQRAWHALRRAVRRCGRPPTDADLHAIRIQAKRVRYAAEALAPICGRAALRLAKRLEHLQTILGDQHDAAASCEQLHQHVGGGEGAFVAGELTTLELAAERRGRRRWRAAWRDVESRRLRFWR